ncbi:hypothetical protein ACJX0J_022365 [Zea mays]
MEKCYHGQSQHNFAPLDGGLLHHDIFDLQHQHFQPYPFAIKNEGLYTCCIDHQNSYTSLYKITEAPFYNGTSSTLTYLNHLVILVFENEHTSDPAMEATGHVPGATSFPKRILGVFRPY